MSRRALLAVAALSLAAASITSAQQPAANAGDLQTIQVRKNIYVLYGAGGNILLSVGKDGVLMVDSGTAQSADRVLAAIQRLQREVDAQERAIELATRI
jgi:cyclase